MFTDDPPDSARRPRVAVLDRTRTAEAVATLSAARQRLGQRLGQHLDDALRPWRARAERLPRWTPVVAALVIYLVIALGYFWWPIHSHFDTMAINYGMPDLGQNLWYLK
ncbi:MAG TPA: hypothetical protein VJR48_14345, partial [Ktedonobacterales bacterium]|nr:hypothetical protein [Ktedonobacterales bacterium]